MNIILSRQLVRNDNAIFLLLIKLCLLLMFYMFMCKVIISETI